MLRKPQTHYTGESQIFKAYRKMRQSNTFRSNVFGNPKDETHTRLQRKNTSPNKTFLHERIFHPSDQKDSSSTRMRQTNTYRHTDIFSPNKVDNALIELSPNRSQDNISRNTSFNQTEKQHESAINVNDLLHSRVKKLKEGQSDIFNVSPNKSTPQKVVYKKSSTTDLQPCYWQNSKLHPGVAGKCNEQASFDRHYSRNQKWKDQVGNLTNNRDSSFHNENSFQQINRKRTSKSEHLDGRGIIPTTISWNQFDSLAYRKAMLKCTDQNTPQIRQQGSQSAFRKMIKENQSSMDQHQFNDKISSSRPQTINKLNTNYKHTSQERIEAFLKGNLTEIARQDVWLGTKILTEGAKSNILYGNTSTSPHQPKKEPEIVKFDVQEGEGKFNGNQLKTFCKARGYGVLKIEEHANKLSHEPIGTASFTLRVKEFLNDDNNAMQQFFNTQGLKCNNENLRQHYHKTSDYQHGSQQTLPKSSQPLEPINLNKLIQEGISRQNGVQPKFFEKLRQDGIRNCTSRRDLPTQKEVNESYKKRVTTFSNKKDNSNISFERDLRPNLKVPLQNKYTFK